MKTEMIKNKITKDQLGQLLVDECLGMSATIFLEIKSGKLTEELENLGFEIMQDYLGVDGVCCFYNDDTLDNVFTLLDSREISSIDIDYEDKSLVIKFVDMGEVYLEFV